MRMELEGSATAAETWALRKWRTPAWTAGHSRQTFRQQGGEPRSDPCPRAVEDQEALKTCALVGQFLDSVRDQVSDLLASGVVPSGVVIGSVFLSCEELLRVKELAVGASAGLLSDRGSQVHQRRPGHVLASIVSLKKVLKESSLPPWVLSLGIWPSGWGPCFRQGSFQQALPIWAPAWPPWTETHPRVAAKQMAES